jgi:hypothetical protein
MNLRSVASPWRTAVVAAAVLVAGAGGAGARAVYDAQNADKVDGFHAVAAGATAASRSGKLVAADANGRLPDAARLGGFNHGQLSAFSISPQSAFVSGTAAMDRTGPVFSATAAGAFTVGFVVPPDHKPTDALTMRVIYTENSDGACTWWASAQGLTGPDGPNTQLNEHNGGWLLPGSSSQHGLVSLPAGLGQVQSTTFRWSEQADPGSYVQFDLTRDGADPGDTCQFFVVRGLQVRY